MTQTLTIRNVPESLARKLKTRAERNHRSLQGEVMAILEQAAATGTAEQPVATYRAAVTGPAATAVPAAATQPAGPAPDRKLSIEQIWERGKRLGLAGPNESADIVRNLRDERHGR